MSGSTAASAMRSASLARLHFGSMTKPPTSELEKQFDRFGVASRADAIEGSCSCPRARSHPKVSNFARSYAGPGTGGGTILRSPIAGRVVCSWPGATRETNKLVEGEIKS